MRLHFYNSYQIPVWTTWRWFQLTLPNVYVYINSMSRFNLHSSSFNHLQSFLILLLLIFFLHSSAPIAHCRTHSKERMNTRQAKSSCMCVHPVFMVAGIYCALYIACTIQRRSTKDVLTYHHNNRDCKCAIRLCEASLRLTPINWTHQRDLHLLFNLKNLIKRFCSRGNL